MRELTLYDGLTAVTIRGCAATASLKTGYRPKLKLQVKQNFLLHIQLHPAFSALISSNNGIYIFSFFLSSNGANGENGENKVRTLECVRRQQCAHICLFVCICVLL